MKITIIIVFLFMNTFMECEINSQDVYGEIIIGLENQTSPLLYLQNKTDCDYSIYFPKTFKSISRNDTLELLFGDPDAYMKMFHYTGNDSVFYRSGKMSRFIQPCDTIEYKGLTASHELEKKIQLRKQTTIQKLTLEFLDFDQLNTYEVISIRVFDECSGAWSKLFLPIIRFNMIYKIQPRRR